MKKINTIVLIGALFITSLLSAQVGVGNEDPKATLDVNKTSYSAGEQAGIAVTQLTGTQIEDMMTLGLKSGTLVYATSTSSTIDAIGFWFYNGTSWAKVGGSSTPSNLSITVPTSNDYTVLESDSVIYRTLTGSGTLTFPATLPAGKIFYVGNTSSGFDWTFSPSPINNGVAQIFAGFSHMVVTLGGGQILVVSGN